MPNKNIPSTSIIEFENDFIFSDPTNCGFDKFEIIEKG